MKPSDLTHKSLVNKYLFQLIKATREGVDFDTFEHLTGQIPLGLSDWSRMLNVSERTMQRYKRDKKRFDAIHSDRLLTILMLFNSGADVFGELNDFMTWVSSINVSMGGVKPINLLDNSFGINMVKDELIKIEHGVLA